MNEIFQACSEAAKRLCPRLLKGCGQVIIFLLLLPAVAVLVVSLFYFFILFAFLIASQIAIFLFGLMMSWRLLAAGLFLLCSLYLVFYFTTRAVRARGSFMSNSCLSVAWNCSVYMLLLGYLSGFFW